MTNLARSLDARKEEGNYRKLTLKPDLIDFCSNDYLGLSSSERLADNIKKRLAVAWPGSGASGARLLSGNYPALEELELKLSLFHGAESALLFPTGYQANFALLSSIAKRNDTYLYDELSHASIKDGIRMSQANSYPFKHNDISDLKKKLRFAKGNVYVVVEALYSMDGDFSPLEDLSVFCIENSLNLIVDEAHTNGLYGVHGKGRVYELGLQNKVFARNMTFGKAIGAQGAAIIGQNVLREYLLNFSRPFIYSTALSPLLTLVIDEAYNLLPELEEERQLLFDNISYFCKHVQGGEKYNSPIQVLAQEGNLAAKSMATLIMENGFDVRAVLSPTVRKGSERLRVCLHSFNTKDEILKLVSIINE